MVIAMVSLLDSDEKDDNGSDSVSDDDSDNDSDSNEYYANQLKSRTVE